MIICSCIYNILWLFSLFFVVFVSMLYIQCFDAVCQSTRRANKLTYLLTYLLTSPCFQQLQKVYFWRYDLRVKRSGHLYTAAYRETRTAAVYKLKWRTDQDYHQAAQRNWRLPIARTNRLWIRSLQLDRYMYIYTPASRTMAFTPLCSLATTHYFSIASITRPTNCYSFTSCTCSGLRTDGRLSWSEHHECK